MRASILVAFVGVLAGCQPEQVPTYRIAYNVFFDRETDNYEIFSMNPDGSDVRNISNTPGVEWVYYAYGDKLFFISDRDTCTRCYILYEMDAFGNNVRKISDMRLQDSWLSSRFEGTELIVDPHSSVDTTFLIIDLQGNVVARVDPDLPYANDPAFSPDGSQIVFRGSLKPFKQDAGYTDELYIINADGTGRRQLTQYPAGDTTAQWWDYHAGPPFWEPSSGFISYHSVQGGRSGVFRIRPDGTGVERLTGMDETAGWHAWAPGGDWFVYDVSVPVNDSTNNYDIFLRKLGEPAATRLTNDPRTEMAPVVVEVSTR